MDPQRQQQLNWVFEQVFIAASTVHEALGRGLPAATYRSCLGYELEQMGRKVQSNVAVPILFREHKVDAGVTIDLIVDGLVAVRVHSIENLTNFYDQEMQTVLRVSGLPLGIVVNFSVPSVRGAMHRIMNPQPRV
ncbi:MAG: GxxExxY protein [Planctomycetes bacterium]|nr:GxxExxY protein [Planctomycetota bacterium]